MLALKKGEVIRDWLGLHEERETLVHFTDNFLTWPNVFA